MKKRHFVNRENIVSCDISMYQDMIFFSFRRYCIASVFYLFFFCIHDEQFLQICLDFNIKIVVIFHRNSWFPGWTNQEGRPETQPHQLIQKEVEITDTSVWREWLVNQWTAHRYWIHSETSSIRSVLVAMCSNRLIVMMYMQLIRLAYRRYH